MTLSSPDQVAAAEANVEVFFGLAGKIFEGFEKLTALNLQAVRATLAATQENMTKVPARLSRGNGSRCKPVSPDLSRKNRCRMAGKCSRSHRPPKPKSRNSHRRTTSAITVVCRNSPRKRRSGRPQVPKQQSLRGIPRLPLPRPCAKRCRKPGNRPCRFAESNFEAVTATASKAVRSNAGQAPVAASAKR